MQTQKQITAGSSGSLVSGSNPAVFRKKLQLKYAKELDILEENDEEMKIAINLEKAIFNYCIQEGKIRKIVKKWENPQFMQLYIDRSRSIYINLKCEKIKDELKKGEILPQQFCFMTHQEMKPEHWREYLTAKSKRDALKYTNNIQASTDLFTCRKCKSKKCTYYELQTRSADEPTSIFVQCIDCGKSWREQ